MTIILFLIILATLVFVHELGHFLTAKLFGIRVDEFAIGFPPKVFGWKRGETQYNLNVIPLGGYVKIFGEDPDDESLMGPDSKRSFVNATKWKQVVVLLSGILMNLIFAWLLISASFNFGMLTSVEDQYKDKAQNVSVMILSILKDSPAGKAGLKEGDSLIKIISDGVQYGTDDSKNLSIVQVQQLILNNKNNSIEIFYERNGKLATTTAILALSLSSSTFSTTSVPVTYKVQVGDSLNMISNKFGFINYKTAGIVSVPSGNFNLIRAGDIITILQSHKNIKTETVNNISGKKTLGISMAMVGTIKFGFFQSFYEGAKLTGIETINITKGIYGFIGAAFHGDSSIFSQVAGPVGIEGMVGQASSMGISYLLGFIAMISINLAMLNLVPFPALDGGRILFVLIEVVIRRRIKPAIANWLNMIGFGLLIALMLFITYKDILRLFTR